MKILKNENGFQIIDLEGQNLSDIDLTTFQNYFGSVLRNAAPFTIEDFESFSSGFGYPLPYGDSNIITFKNIHNENELHYDGISADDPRKIPKFVTFYVENCPDPKTQGGSFLLADCITAFNALPKGLQHTLRKTKQHFYGYPYNFKGNDFKEKNKILEWSFSINVVGKCNGQDLLRMQIPSGRSTVVHENDSNLVYSGAHDLCFRLEGFTGKESIKIYDKIRETIMDKRITKTIMFQPKDILIVDNKKAFHGRNFVKDPQERLMHRIQLLEEKFF